jgi:hypothetical protein
LPGAAVSFWAAAAASMVDSTSRREYSIGIPPGRDFL